MEDYIEEVKIDFLSLDQNWKDQPTLYMKWAIKWSEATAKRNRLKDTIEKEKSRLYLDILNNFGDHGFDKKPTEAAIKAEIDNIMEIRENTIQNKIISLTKKIDESSSVLKSLEHRKAALDGLTRLFTTGYFTVPNAPRVIKEIAKEERKKEIIKKQKEHLDRKEE